jgi:hypothetical protein
MSEALNRNPTTASLPLSKVFKKLTLLRHCEVRCAEAISQAREIASLQPGHSLRSWAGPRSRAGCPSAGRAGSADRPAMTTKN